MPAGCKESASRDGTNNIAAHFPENAQAAPDLGRTFILLSCRPTDLRCHIGPKMYAACGGQGNATKGTTNLHLDVSDAVNFITWTFDSSRPSAIWHVFPRHSISGLHDFLQATRPELRNKDPIHAQAVYLTDLDLQQLAHRHKVVPWIIEQRQGDLIFIPTGCPHQVRLHC